MFSLFSFSFVFVVFFVFVSVKNSFIVSKASVQSKKFSKDVERFLKQSNWEQPLFSRSHSKPKASAYLSAVWFQDCARPSLPATRQSKGASGLRLQQICIKITLYSEIYILPAIPDRLCGHGRPLTTDGHNNCRRCCLCLRGGKNQQNGGPKKSNMNPTKFEIINEGYHEKEPQWLSALNH